MSETTNNYAAIETQFGDGVHLFFLKWDQAAEWEAETGRSLFSTYRNMLDGTFNLPDIVSILRFALIGGGASPTDALKLVDRYVKGQPLAEYQELTLHVLHAAFYGQNLMDDIVERQEQETEQAAA